EPLQESRQIAFPRYVFYGGLRANRGGARQNQFGVLRIDAFDERDNRIIFIHGDIRETRTVGSGFALTRRYVDDFHLSRARTLQYAAEEELFRAGNFQKREFSAGRADEDQIVVFGVVERKEAATFYAQRLVQGCKNKVEVVYGQNFAHTGV